MDDDWVLETPASLTTQPKHYGLLNFTKDQLKKLASRSNDDYGDLYIRAKPNKIQGNAANLFNEPIKIVDPKQQFANKINKIRESKSRFIPPSTKYKSKLSSVQETKEPIMSGPPLYRDLVNYRNDSLLFDRKYGYSNADKQFSSGDSSVVRRFPGEIFRTGPERILDPRKLENSLIVKKPYNAEPPVRQGVINTRDPSINPNMNFMSQMIKRPPASKATRFTDRFINKISSYGTRLKNWFNRTSAKVGRFFSKGGRMKRCGGGRVMKKRKFYK